MSIVLGPCRCQGCGRPVYWDTFAWQSRTQWGKYHTHRCAASNGRSEYNGRAGSSSQSDSMAHGARLPATTRKAGAVARHEVVAR